MHSTALVSIKDIKAYSKCAQLYSIIHEYCASFSPGIVRFHFAQIAKRIIRKEGDINFLIPSDFLARNQECQDIQEGTILHIPWKSRKNEILEDILNLGADFTIKNKHGDTALHCAFKLYSSENDEYSKCNNHSHVITLLTAHIKFANSSNPCNNSGLTHFQIACMVNSTDVVEFFLLNGVDVNQVIDHKTKQYLGFTPLHYAVNNCSIETIELLLKYGADKTIKNGYGMTPLHQLLNQKIKLFKEDKFKQDSENRVKAIDAGIFIFLGNNFLDKIQFVDNTGLSSFHIACTMQNLSMVESLLDQVKDIDHCVKMESTVWPGFTALHFAAHCNNIQVMELLQRRGASIDVKNAKGLTALDICLRIGHVEELHAAISLKSEWANILFSDNKTRLVNILSAMQYISTLDDFLHDNVDDINMTLPSNSPVWPGCTPLHLAVIISTKYVEHSSYNGTVEKESILEQIEMLLKAGADVTRKDARGKTPIHHAFRENKKKVSALLYNYHHSSVNPVDQDNLSHLHIACADHHESLLKKLLSSNNIDGSVRYNGEKAVRNVKPGYTPLNCLRSIEYGFFGQAKQMLIKRGAKDFRYGVNTLHSACDQGDVDAVQRLLALGADVNFSPKGGLTPLHLAINRRYPRVVQLLLQKGANLIARDYRGHSPLSRIFEIYDSRGYGWEASAKNILTCRQLVFAVLKRQVELQKRMEKETGIAMLHIACHMLDVAEVRKQLEQGAEVNAQVHEDSKLWPGCTALHVLMCKIKERLSEEEKESDVNVITQLLLENGIDVTLANIHMDTSIHFSYESFGDSRSRTASLLKHHHDFRINPINSNGLSHFHLAIILNCVDVVQKFLEHGVDVNQPTNLFIVSRDKYYPLHMALDNVRKLSDVRVVRLLLNHGADVNLEDSTGRSAIHKALYTGPLKLEVMEILLSFGADINSQDIYGYTPLETLLDWFQYDSATVKDIQFFLQRGCRVNVNNPVTGQGYLGVGVLQHRKEDRYSFFEELMKAPDVAVVNEMGRTIIHNVVAVRMGSGESYYNGPVIEIADYIVLLERLKVFGFDIDNQDHAGQTALHIAAQLRNSRAISALLNVGADLNIVDSKGKSALSYASPYDNELYCFGEQVNKLIYFGLTVSQLNNDIITHDYDCNGIDSRLRYLYAERFYHEVEATKSLAIGELPLTLGDFLSESNAVVKYSRMSESSRDVIDKYFESNCTQFDEILSILKLQHRKAMKRFRLVETVSTMKDLVGFALPALCADNILRFLSIVDLENVVAAINFEA